MRYLNNAKLKVIYYMPHPHDVCVCEDESGDRWMIDLVVAGDLGNLQQKELVGKTVTIDDAHPFSSIAHGVKIEGEA